MFRSLLSAAFFYQPPNAVCLLQPVCSHLAQAGTVFGTRVVSLRALLPPLSSGAIAARAARALVLSSKGLCHEAAAS